MEDTKKAKPEKEVFDIEIEDISDEDMAEATRLALESVDSDAQPISHLADALEEPSEEDEVESLRGRLARALADYDNLRKRTEREKGDISRFALNRILLDLLSTLDNFERALSAEGSVEDLKAGLQMIYQQFAELMEKYGVKAIETQGQPFDPSFHEAVARVEDASVKVPTVLDEFQKGYLLHNRLLRASMVRVSVPVEEEVKDTTEENLESED